MLRTRAGLSQEAMALMLGLGRGTGKAQVSKMETGRYKAGPGFARLLDYLRACGCGIGSVLDILDRYTSKQPVSKEQASKAVLAAIADMPERLHRRAHYYHVGLTYKAGEPAPSAAAAAKRIRQAVARGRAERWELRLRRLFNDVRCELHLAGSNTLAIFLGDYGRLVFATLRRLRHARPVWREKALARLDEWPEKMRLEPAPFRRMKVAVMELFEKLERAGELE